MKEKHTVSEQNGIVVGKTKKRNKKVWIAAGIGAVLLVFTVVQIFGGTTKEVAVTTELVQVEPVQKRDLSDTIALKGSIAGVSKTNVVSKAVSEVTSMKVQVGDVVKKGDVLCTLDSTSIEEKIEDLEKNVSDANAVESLNNKQASDAVQQAKKDQEIQVNEAKIQLEQAQAAVGGVVQQQQSGQVVDFATAQAAQQAYEAAQRNYALVLETTDRAIKQAELQAQLNQYQNTDNTAEDTLDDLREQLEDCEVIAPNGGVVTAVNVSVGDINTEKNIILTIEDTSALKLVAPVDESDILHLEEGMSATVTADATGDKKITGKVTRVVRVKSQSAGAEGATAGGYSVEISIDNTELLVGMDAKAKVMIQEKGEVLAVPYDLIQYNEDGTAFVLVAEGNEDGTATAVKKNIEVGEEVDYYTEITGGELKEGDKLIYDYSFTITEGQSFSPEQMYSDQELGNGDETADSAGDGAVSVEVVE